MDLHVGALLDLYNPRPILTAARRAFTTLPALESQLHHSDFMVDMTDYLFGAFIRGKHLRDVQNFVDEDMYFRAVWHGEDGVDFDAANSYPDSNAYEFDFEAMMSIDREDGERLMVPFSRLAAWIQYAAYT